MAEDARDPKRIVRDGYDAVSRLYVDDEGAERAGVRRRWLAPLFAELPEGAPVVDLGCGAGVPATRMLAERFRVTGVDISPVQIERARQLVPGADFRVADMTTVEFAADSLDAVVSLYAVIHVPLAEQPPLFERIHSWLKPGGLLLVTAGAGEFTGTEENWLGGGAEMYWSQADEQTYRAWLEGIGFRLRERTFVPEGESGHVLLLVQKAMT